MGRRCRLGRGRLARAGLDLGRRLVGFGGGGLGGGERRELDRAFARAAALALLPAHGRRRAGCPRQQAVGIDAARLQGEPHGRGPRERQFHRGALVVGGVSLQRDHRKLLRLVLDHDRDRIEHRERLRFQLGAVVRERDPLDDLDHVVAVDGARRQVRAPVAVLIAVVGLRVGRALVVAIGHPVAVAVNRRRGEREQSHPPNGVHAITLTRTGVDGATSERQPSRRCGGPG